MPETQTPFVNTAQKSDPSKRGYGRSDHLYGFDRVPPLLFSWSRLFQCVISQAGTFLLTGGFHNKQCSIYKSEGGCNIPGVGELVLGRSGCHFDHVRSHGDAREKQMARLITDVVLGWDPVDPVDSMLRAAAAHVCGEGKWTGKDEASFVEALREALKLSREGGPFGGDALATFFDWNPFSEPPVDRDYMRFCLTKHDGKTDADVDQMFADEDLGKSLHERLKEAVKKLHSPYEFYVLCCFPNRQGDNLRFWINTGQFTQIDGWKTQEEIEAWLAKGEPLRNSM